MSLIKFEVNVSNWIVHSKSLHAMFANAFQTGFISIFYSVGSSPLSIWDKQVKNGHIRRIVDDEVKSLVLELSGTNVATTYITTPIKPRASLGIRLPFLVLIVKNMKKYFSFEIQILDDKNMHRRFRVSNFQSTTKVRPFCTTMPIGLSTGWNQIQFNLADFTRRAYGTVYIETMRVQIHANARIRRIYFSDRLYSDEEMPNEYKLFMPTKSSERRSSKDGAYRKPSDSASANKVATEAVTTETKDPLKTDEPEAIGQEGVEPIEVPREDGEPQGAPPSPVESELPSPEPQEEGIQPVEGEESPTDDMASPVLVPEEEIEEHGGEVTLAEAGSKEKLGEEGVAVDQPIVEDADRIEAPSDVEETEAAGGEVGASELAEVPAIIVEEEGKVEGGEVVQPQEVTE